MLHRHFPAPSFCFTQLVQWLQCQRPQGIESARLGGCGSWDYQGHDTQRCYSSHGSPFTTTSTLNTLQTIRCVGECCCCRCCLGNRHRIQWLTQAGIHGNGWATDCMWLLLLLDMGCGGISNVWMSCVVWVKVIHMRVSAKCLHILKHQNAKRNCEANVETMSERGYWDWDASQICLQE